ncbi:MAG: cytochrome c-type biogenesis protein CcmH, partial [Granulosicoccaceae bacterium]
DRYGDYVLLKPRKAGTGLPLWLFPPVILLLVAMFAFQVMRKRPTDEPVEPNSTLSDEDRERIRRAREEERKRQQDKDEQDS